MVVVMADVDITSLSVEISAESQGAELNINKLANAIANLRSKGNVSAVCDSLDKLAGSIAGLKSASKGIGSIFKNIEKMSNIDVSGIDFTGLSAKLESLKSELQPLQNLDASGLKAVGSAMNAIAKIPSINDKLDADTLNKFKTACNSISTSLTPLASQLDKVGNAFAKLPPQLSKVVTQANRVTAANEKQRKSYLSLSNQMNGFMRNMAKLVSLKAIAEYLGNAVAKFNDFYEATDLFHNAMGNLSGEADTLISKMQGLLGVDPTKAMTYMATIQSLGTSFGLASDKAYILSKNLTQLAYDEGSYWNKDVAETFTAMSSAISGEIEPIRRLGIDLSQARLQQELLALGFNKQVSSLSQADKAVLRYIAIMKQTANVQGNLAQTIQSPANQIKILKAQLDMLAKSVGSLLYPAMKSILPPLIAAVQLIREFVEWVAKLMGVKVVFTDFTKSADSVGGIGDAMDNTADSTKKAAKALKDYTMGFDELNIIDPTQGSSGSGSGASAGNILGDVDLSGYDMFKNYVGNAVDEIKAKLEKLAPLIAGISAGFATWAIGNALLEALNKIKGDGSLIEGILKLWKSPIMGAAVAVGIMVARFVDLYQNSEAFRKGLERVQAMIYLAAEGLRQGWNISLTDGKLGESIKYLKESFSNLKQVIWNLIPESWQEGISSAFKTISDAVKDLDLDVGDLITTLMGIGLIVSGHPVAGLAVLGFEAITVAVRGLGSESQKEAFEMETDWFNAFKSMGEKVADFVGDAITAIGNLINDFAIFIGWIQNGVSETDRLDLQMNGNFIENAVMGIAQLIHDIGVFVGWITNGVSETDRLDIQMNGNFIEKAVLGFADLINWVKNVVTWFVHLDEHVENGARAVRGFIDDIKTWAKDAAKAASDMVTAVANAIASLPSKMSEAGKNIWQGLVNGIKSGIETAKGAAANLAKAIIDKFTTDTEVHSPSALFERFGEFIVQGLANGIAAAIPYVTTAMQGVVDAVQEKGNALIAAGSTQATNYVTGFLNGLDTQWQQIDSSLQNDFLGSMQTLGTAIEKGDLQSLGKWAASYFYHAMDDEQRTQIKSIAENSLTWLTSNLSGVWNNIAGMASSFIGQLVPSTVAATTAQTGLNIAMDANPILFVVSLIAMLAGALLNLAGTNSDVAGGISSVWGGLKDFMSYIFEGIVRLLGTFVQGFINGVNIMIGAYNLVAQLWGGQIDYIKNPLFEYADKIAAARENSSSVDSLASGNLDYSSVPGTSEYEQASGSGSYSSSSYTRSAELTPSELRDSVKEGFIAALQESGFGDTDNGNFTVRVYLDGKEITSAVEKRQSDRGMSLMGTEAYSY